MKLTVNGEVTAAATTAAATTIADNYVGAALG